MVGKTNQKKTYLTQQIHKNKGKEMKKKKKNRRQLARATYETGTEKL